MTPGARLGYVVTMFPRLSETFILGEILELERRGWRPVIFTRKPAGHQPVHADYARIRGKIFQVGVTRLRDGPGVLRDHTLLFLKRPRAWMREARTAFFRRRASARRKFLVAGRVARRALALGLTHIHAHFAADNAKIARIAARLTGASFSFTAHAKDIWVKTPPDSLRKLMGSARFTVTICRYNLDHLLPLAPDPTRLHLIYNGLNTLKFRPPSSRRNGNGPRELLAVGRLVPKKGFDILPETCRILSGRGFDFRCRLVGDGELRSNLETAVRDHGMEDRLLLEGPRTQERLIDTYLARADILLAPCVIAPDGDRDGIPTVILEALSMGIPVVAAAVAGIPEVIRSRVTGILVEPGSPSALARAAAELIQNPGLAARLGRAGARRVREMFDIGENVGRLDRLFREGGE